MELSNKSKRYGLMVVGASWLAVFCLFGYRATFAMLKEPMATELGWTQAEVTLGYSLMMTVYAIVAFFAGMILDKWGTKPVYAIAAIFGGLGFYLTSLVSLHWAYLFTFGVLAGIATGMLWVTSTVSVRKWYVGKTYGTMWGIAFAGAPMAQWLLAEVVKASTSNNYTWRTTMVILAVIIFALLVLAVILAKRNPEYYGLKPHGELPASAAGNVPVEKDWTVKEAYSKYPIWGAILMFLTSMMAEFLIWTQVVSFWIKDKGWSDASAINVYKTIGIIGIFSMPLLGIFGDKIVEKVKNEVKGRKIMLIIGPLVGLIACLFLLACESKVTFVAYLAAAIFAIYWAIVPGGVVGYTGSIYGRKTLGKIWGLATLIVMGIGPFLGSFIGGWLKDVSGSYMYSIYYAIGSFVLSAILAVSLPMTIKPSK